MNSSYYEDYDTQKTGLDKLRALCRSGSLERAKPPRRTRNFSGTHILSCNEEKKTDL